jgi:hypothetical protein
MCLYLFYSYKTNIMKIIISNNNKIYFVMSFFFYLIISNYLVLVLGEEGGEVGGGEGGREGGGGRDGRGGSVIPNTSTEYTSGTCSLTSHLHHHWHYNVILAFYVYLRLF